MSSPRSFSIQKRLLNYSRNRQVNHNHTLMRYGIERLMYRLSCSPYKDRFVLKGAMMFYFWLENAYRPTRDLDLLGLGELSADSLRSIFEDTARYPLKMMELNSAKKKSSWKRSEKLKYIKV